jgi:hypothetical protein
MPLLHIDAPSGQVLGSDERMAVQTPIPIPTGTEPKRRIVVPIRLMNQCYFLTFPPLGT